MALILYVIIFTAVCYWRRRNLSGAHLKEKLHTSGREYLENLLVSDKGRSVKATLGLVLDNAQPFAVRREKSYHRLLKSMGLAEEVSTGDSTVDDTLFFVTETPEGFHEILSKKGTLESIHKLFSAYGVKDLRCFGGKVWITCTTVGKAAYTPAFIAERLEALGTIANAAEAAGANRLPSADFMTKPRMAAFFMIVHAALFTLGIFGGLPLMMESMEILRLPELIYTGGIIAALLTAFWIYCIVICLGRTSWIPMVAADFVLMGIAGIFLSVIFTTREINMHFDRAPAKDYVREIVAKQCELTCSRGSGKRRSTSHYQLSESQCATSARGATLSSYRSRDSKCNSSANFSYELLIEPWLQGQTENFNYTVSEAVYDTTRRGAKMNVPSREGALGIAWVDTAEIRPAK